MSKNNYDINFLSKIFAITESYSRNLITKQDHEFFILSEYSEKKYDQNNYKEDLNNALELYDNDESFKQKVNMIIEKNLFKGNLLYFRNVKTNKIYPGNSNGYMILSYLIMSRQSKHQAQSRIVASLKTNSYFSTLYSDNTSNTNLISIINETEFVSSKLENNNFKQAILPIKLGDILKQLHLKK